MNNKQLPLALRILFSLILVSASTLSLAAIFMDSSLRNIINKEKNEQYNFRLHVIHDSILKSYLEAVSRMDQFEEAQSGKLDPQSLEAAKQQMDYMNQQVILQELRSQYYNSKNTEELQAYPFIIDKEGKVLLHPDLPYGDESLKNYDFIKNCLIQKKGDQEYIYNGVKKWMVFTDFNGWQWQIAYTLSRSLEYKGVEEFRLIMILILILSFVLVLISVGFQVQHALKPLGELQEKLKNIADGQGDLTGEVNLKAHNEIGAVSKEFNRFVKSLRHIIAGVKKSARDLAGIREDLDSQAQESAASAKQIESSISKMTERMENLHGDLDKSSLSLVEIRENLEKNRSINHSQVLMAKETNQEIRTILDYSQNTSKLIQDQKEITGSLEHSAEKGDAALKDLDLSFQKELSPRIENIKDFIHLIQDISSQINLLSMNAAIEAAHAGNQGRGFAVVAEEIRRLADATSRNTQQITKSLEEILKALGSTRKNMDSVSGVFNDINKKSAAVKEAFVRIEQEAASLSNQAHRIDKTTETLEAGSEQVEQQSLDISQSILTLEAAIQNIDQYADQILGGMKEISLGALEISQSTKHLYKTTGILKDHSREMDEGLSSFICE